MKNSPDMKINRNKRGGQIREFKSKLFIIKKILER